MNDNALTFFLTPTNRSFQNQPQKNNTEALFLTDMLEVKFK